MTLPETCHTNNTSNRHHDNDTFMMGNLMNEVDSILAKNISNLPQKEREKSYDDVHGVPEHIEETPELIQTSLRELDTAIENIQDKQAYNLAKTLNSAYVCDRDFRLMFLRGEDFDRKAAAQKLVNHFELKLDLFGASKLTKDICQDDLEEEAIESLYDGWQQRVPVNDSSGRSIRVVFPSSRAAKFSYLSRVQRAFYTRMDFCQKTAVLKAGGLCIVNLEEMEEGGVFQNLKLLTDLRKHSQRLPVALPGIVRAIHIICLPKQTFAMNLSMAFLRGILQTLNPLLRVRVQFHKDSSKEACLASLKRYGIPVEAFPESSLDKESHCAYWKEQLQRERQNQSQKQNQSFNTAVHVPFNNSSDYQESSKVVDPCPMDVIFGRGKPLMDHPGNVKFRKVIDESYQAYEACPREEKKHMTAKIVVIIKESGRFIKREGNGWVEVDDEAARLKISHCFRDLRRKK